MRTILVMAESIPKKPQVTLDAEDQAALEALRAELPWLLPNEAATLVRLLMRVGIHYFAQSPLEAIRFKGSPSAARVADTVRAAMARRPTVGPPEMSPATGVTPAGGMSRRDLEAGMSAPPPSEATPEPEPPAPKPPKPRKPRDPAKGKGRKDDPTREPTQDELDDYNRRARR
jgi:hypothetical protein